MYQAVEEGKQQEILHAINYRPGTCGKGTNLNGETLVHHAAWREPGDKAECLEAVLGMANISVNAVNNNGFSALHLAAANGRDAATRLLVRSGARPSVQTTQGETALHLAAESGNANCIAIFLDCGVDLNAFDKAGQTALHVAAAKGHIDVVKVFLEGKASVDVTSYLTACTPLHLAAQGGHMAVVELLLRAGANSQATNTAGETPGQLAREAGHDAIAARLGAARKETDADNNANNAAPMDDTGLGAGQGVSGEAPKAGLCEASDAMRNRVQELMDTTWKNSTTRDRAYAEVAQFEVVQVLENNNSALSQKFRERRERLSLHYVTALHDIKTVTASWESGLKEPRKTEVNEFFLFHGTKPSAAVAICKSGFNVDLSGSNKGMLYGPGIYCAESSAKADEYAGDDDKDGLYKGLYAMLLCRVCLGNVVINEEVTPNVEEIDIQLEAEDKHSVMGDREKVRGTFREFVLRDPSQVYPAYAVIYRRKQLG